MTDDICWLDATAQADLVRRGEVSAAELVEAAIVRIDKLDPVLNAVIHRRFDDARRDAAAEQLPAGPFAGVPFLLKDVLAHEAGQPNHCGMRVLKEAGWTEPADTWLVERFRRAGFISLGRTNLPELASTLTTEPLAYGPTHNPWDLARSPGGSSGGAAAAVAAGLVPVAHGNDMGGSIRVPAANCGLVGLKPTRGRTTLGPDFGEYWGPLTHQGVLTRSVRDTAAVLDAITGAGPGDPYTAPAPRRPWLAETAAEPGRLRIGVRATLPGGAPVDAEVSVAVAETARLLEALGHHVEVVEVPAFDSPALGEAFPAVFATAVARDVDRWSSRLGRPIALDELEPLNAALVELGRSIPGTAYLGALEGLQGWTRALAAQTAALDVLVTPVSPEPPVPLDRIGPLSQPPMALIGELIRLSSFTIPFNVTGQPALSLPLHWTPSGLPVGVQFVADQGREDVLIRLAAQLEQARPWAHRRPPAAS